MFSILICALDERKEKLDKLLAEVQLQAQPHGNEIEILHESDNRQMPTGKKRNVLIDRAIGDYVAFVDDDDWIDSEYVKLIIEACREGNDCIGIKGIINFKTQQWAYFTHSIECTGWYTGVDGYYRTPNHLNPVKRNIAAKVRFNDLLYIGEDQDYSTRILKYLKTETFIEKPIYHYWSRVKIA
jgi:glycosyltransferase involved in cell wall biosynthesis